ncbi:MAG: hypothetical protein HGA59_06935 [Chlorobiaceae bacterium]|nr:hypothetical protein [Chlorobiaceae bacterium]
MKRLILVLIGMIVFNVSVQAQIPGRMGQRGAIPAKGAMMGNAIMNCPVTDVMESMIAVMKVEQKLLSDIKGSEKRELKADLEQKMALLEQRMADMKAAQMPCISGGTANAAGGQFTPPCMQNTRNGKFIPPCFPNTPPAAK